MEDIRDVIFRDVMNCKYKAQITADNDGILSGTTEATSVAIDIGVEINFLKNDGERLSRGTVIATVIGTPKQIAIAEDRIIGCLSKFSGIATAANKAVHLSNGQARIVSGSLKKMPSSIKSQIRKAISDGGADVRISRTPMVYIDKNYIKILGSITLALATVGDVNLTKVIQIKGIQNTIEEEVQEALNGGCTLLMVDSGKVSDLIECIRVVNLFGDREKVEIAFAGNIKISDIPELIKYDLDIICIGKEIVDALLLDMKLDIIS